MKESVDIQLDGKTVRAYCDAVAVAETKALMVTLQDRARQGLQVREEVRLIVGWTHFLLRSEDGALVLHEPNYATNPVIAFRRDVTTSVLVHRDMLATAHARGVLPVFSRFSDRIVVSKDWLKTTPLRIVRDPNGWRFGTAGDDDNIRVYQLLSARPALLRYLALPVGTDLPVD